MLSARNFALGAIFAVGVALAHQKVIFTTPQRVLAEIEKKGARATLEEILGGQDEAAQKRWDQFISKIESGTAAWLSVAQKLYPATDAATREDMNITLAVALTHNPEDILERTGRDDWPTLNQVCTVPFIESSPATDAAHIRKVRAALSRVTNPALKNKKDDCLKFINADAARPTPH